MNDENSTQTFFVTSYGRTATGWLTKILNSHPDIYCTHGPTLKEYNNVHNRANTINPRGAETIEEISREAQNEINKFHSLTLDEIFYGMKKLRDNAVVYGNVHAFSAQLLAPRLATEKFSFPYQHLNIVRHPFTRIESWTRHCTEQSLLNPIFKEQILDVILKSETYHTMKKMLLASYDIDFSNIRNQLFLYAVILLTADFTDLAVDCKHIRYEQLVNDIEFFIYFFKYITHNQVPLHDNLFKIYHGKTQKVGVTSSGGFSSVKAVEEWEKWQITAVQFSFQAEPRIIQIYKDMKYEVDFIFDL